MRLGADVVDAACQARAVKAGRYMQIEGMAELTPPLIDADPAKLPPIAA